MMKTTNWMLMALLVVGIGMNFVSCKEDELTDEEKQQQAEQAVAEAQEWWDVVSQLTDVQELPKEWQKATFEPAVGKALESDPYTRVVSTNDLATAAQRFAYLTGAPVDESTADYTWSHKDAGSLTYHAGSPAGTYLAQVDVNLKQMPKLKKILYQTPDQMGDNASGSFSGTAYYRFGDVVSKKKANGRHDYWVCVRPAFSLEGKGDSHWICVNDLPEKNIYSYSYGDDTWNLPTKLGESKEHMQNFAELLYAIADPDQYYANLADLKLKTFHDFGREKFTTYHNKAFWKRVSKAWKNEAIYQDVFDGLTSDEVNNLVKNDKKGLNFIYKGYSWMFGWNCTLWRANYKGTNLKTASYTSTKKDMRDVSFNVKLFNMLYENSVSSFFGTSDRHFIVRYATGEELCMDENGKKAAYSVKNKLSNCEDVYVYNKYYYQNTPDGMYDLGSDPEVTPEEKESTTHGFFAPGSVIRDEQGKLWVCYASWFDDTDVTGVTSGSHTSHFISFDAVRSAEESVVSTDPSIQTGVFARDLLPKDEVLIFSLALCGAAYPSSVADNCLAGSLINHLGVNPSDLVLERDSVVTANGKTTAARILSLNLAYTPGATGDKVGRQPFIRYVVDGTRVAGNRGQEAYRYHYLYSRYPDETGSPLNNITLDATNSFYWQGMKYDGLDMPNFAVPYDRWSHCVRHDTQKRDGNFTSKDYYREKYDWHLFKPSAKPQHYSTYFEPITFVSYLAIDDDLVPDFTGTYGGKRYTLIADPMENIYKGLNQQFWYDLYNVVLPYLFEDGQRVGIED